MAPPQAGRRQEWADFCSARDGSRASPATEFWAAYTAVYAQLLKWGKYAKHATFCYQLMVAMVTLAAGANSGEGGGAFADTKRCEQLLALLANALKKDASRGDGLRADGLQVIAL